jgi:hypothetical protein
VPAPRATKVRPRRPVEVERQLGDATYAALAGLLGEDAFDQLLYARIDMAPGSDGLPLLMEVELIEPSLYFALDVDAPGLFADAVAARLGLPPRLDEPGEGVSGARVPLPRPGSEVTQLLRPLDL